jgi:hypothetical protein
MRRVISIIMIIGAIAILAGCDGGNSVTSVLPTNENFAPDKAKTDFFTIYQGLVPESGDMTVPVYLACSGNAKGIKMIVEYDSNVATLLLDDCYTGDLFDANSPSFFGTIDPDELDFACLPHNFVGNGYLVYLVFSIQDRDGDPDIKMASTSEVRNGSNQNISWGQQTIKIGN